MQQKSYSYINDFMYFIVRPAEAAGFVYCSGVNVSRFTPLTAGKHRLGQNIVMKGLQSSNIELRSFILGRGAQPKTVRGGGCHDEKVRVPDEVWTLETLMVENPPEDFTAEELGIFSVKNFLKVILPQCVQESEIPQELPDPEGLQAWLESRCGI
ncbi:MAG: hypothetical protein HQK97_08530 [Nitrospirae bacterium]|nr:hypothetical protein [Nitrospirota bacterium]